MAAQHKLFHFALNIPEDELLLYYQGTARTVVARSMEGATVEFPAVHLRSFVTRSGVQGVFQLEVDEYHKFVALRRVG